MKHGGQPKFGLTIRVSNMDVNPQFLSRKEKQPKLTISNHRGCHVFKRYWLVECD